MFRPLAMAAVALCTVGCAGGPQPPAAGMGTLTGTVKLVPREGVKLPKAGGNYGDRRYRDVEAIDYSSPGFVVVFVAGVPAAATASSLSLGRSRVGALRFDPANGAVSVGGTIRIKNEDKVAHMVSCPELGVVEKLEAGASADFSATEAGPLNVFVLDAPGLEAAIFAAPGRFAVATSSGRWTIPDLPPGSHAVRTWHPRFPGTSLNVDLREGQIQDVNLPIGVDALKKETP